MKGIAEQSLYEILDVRDDASAEEITAACARALALYGPGSLATYTLMSAEEAALLVRRVEEARTTLLDREARARYDEARRRAAEIRAASAAAVGAGMRVPVIPPRAPELARAFEATPLPPLAPLPPPDEDEEEGEEAEEEEAEALEDELAVDVEARCDVAGFAAEGPPAVEARRDEEVPSEIEVPEARQSEEALPASSAPPEREARTPETPSGHAAPPSAETTPRAGAATPPVGAPEPPLVAAPEPPAPRPPIRLERELRPPSPLPDDGPEAVTTPIPLVPPAPPPAPVVPDGGAWSGEVLRRLREARGISLQQISERTKVTRHHIENIEAERFAQLPAPVYLRGILLALARELRLDGQKVARSYLERAAAAKGR